MKKITTILTAALLFATVTQATIRTVSNFPANVAQFNNIQDAVNASAAGDTILVHGSPTAYADFDFNKKLTIIGPGFSPNKQLPFTVTLNFINLLAGAADSEIQGLTVFLVRIQNAGINNIRFIRNTFTGGIEINAAGSGHVIEGNNFPSAAINFQNIGPNTNIVIQNNMFLMQGFFSILGLTNSSNVLINHNLFYATVFGSTVFANPDRGVCRFLTITNNIFVNQNAGSAQSSVFSNNITFNTANNTPWNVNNNVNAGGNIENQDPQMVDQAAVNAGTNNPIGNFTIAAGPANNSASDGKDIGLLFDATGALNWTNSRMSRLPYINTMNITTPTVAPGGNVEVNIQAKTNN